MSDVLTTRFRTKAEERSVLDREAEIEGVSLSEFIRSHVLPAARELVASAQLPQVTAIEPESFDELMDALDDTPNARLRRARQRAAELDDVIARR